MKDKGPAMEKYAGDYSKQKDNKCKISETNGYMTVCICHSPEKLNSRVNLNACKLKKSFKRSEGPRTEHSL